MEGLTDGGVYEDGASLVLLSLCKCAARKEEEKRKENEDNEDEKEHVERGEGGDGRMATEVSWRAR